MIALEALGIDAFLGSSNLSRFSLTSLVHPAVFLALLNQAVWYLLFCGAHALWDFGLMQVEVVERDVLGAAPQAAPSLHWSHLVPFS